MIYWSFLCTACSNLLALITCRLGWSWQICLGSHFRLDSISLQNILTFQDLALVLLATQGYTRLDKVECQNFTPFLAQVANILCALTSWFEHLKHSSEILCAVVHQTFGIIGNVFHKMTKMEHWSSTTGSALPLVVFAAPPCCNQPCGSSFVLT